MEIKHQLPTHILSNLLNNEDYCRRVIPYIKREFFEGSHRTVFDLITQFVGKHNKLPTTSVLELELRKSSAPDDILNESAILIAEISKKIDIDTDYLIKESEKWCRDRAVYNAIMDSIQIIDGKSKDKTEGAIPEIVHNNHNGFLFEKNNPIELALKLEKLLINDNLNSLMQKKAHKKYSELYTKGKFEQDFCSIIQSILTKV